MIREDLIDVCENALMCPGRRSGNFLMKASSSNAFVIREDDTLFVVDTGAGRDMKHSVLSAVENLRGESKKLVLINTHSHVDHIGNNGAVMSLEGFKAKRHLIHEKAEPMLSPYDFFLSLHREIDKYYDLFEGPPPPWRFLTRFMALGNRKSHLENMVRSSICKFEPLDISQNTMEYLKESDMKPIQLGSYMVDQLKMAEDAVCIDLEPLSLSGWPLNGAFLLADGSHSPDHIVAYFPNKKLLITGDLTLEFFPIYPKHSSEKIIMERLRNLQDMAREGVFEILVDSHHKKVYRGENEIVGFLKGIVNTHNEFRDVLLSCFEDGKGETIKSLYRKLRRHRFESPSVDFHLESQFPNTPFFLKTIITAMLLERNFQVEGQGAEATFHPAG